MSRRPRLLDLFCGAGGAAMGYHRAGFDVVGVDLHPQPRYPFAFIQADALEAVIWAGCFDAIHASPPCQHHSAITRVHGTQEDHPNLIPPTRNLLRATGLPYVIENVPGAPLESPAVLCGAAFGLGCDCDDGQRRHLKRHRLFETSFTLWGGGCACGPGEPIGVYGYGGGQHKTVRNGGVNRGYMGRIRECREAMRIEWMTKAEISQSIPPAYTELIGHQLRELV